MDPLNIIHGGNVYDFEWLSEPLIDFSANINPLPLPVSAKKAFIKALHEVSRYPDTEYREIREALAVHWGIDKSSILMGNGSTELIYSIVHALSPESVFVPSPTFMEYEQAARIFKRRVHFIGLVREEGFAYLSPSLKEREMVFICNPNNPTGNLLLENRNIHRLSEKGIVVIDEAYMDFLTDEDEHTFARLAENNKRVIVIRSFTKVFAMAGLRIGYAISHPDTIKAIKGHMIPWSVNTLAQKMAMAMLADHSYLERTKRFIKREQKYLYKGLQNIEGLFPYPSVTNYILVRLDRRGITTPQLKERLIEKGMLIRDCSNFRRLGKDHFRVAVRTRRENKTLLNGLKEAVQKTYRIWL